MRCARAQAAAADDRCGRCCRWTLPCVVGGAVPPSVPFRRLVSPPTICHRCYRRRRRRPLSLPSLPPPPDPSRLPVLLAMDSGTGRTGKHGRRNDDNNNRHSGDGIDNVIRSHRIVVAHAELTHSLSYPGRRISDINTRNLRSRYAESRSDYGAAAWLSSSQRRIVIRN